MQTPGDYGVPVIRTSDLTSAMEELGRHHAHDRLWQMEMARRVSSGTLAEVQGASAVASDAQARQTGYTPEELEIMLESLADEDEAMFAAYARGVNSEIDRRKEAGDLPGGYAQLGFEPGEWKVTDSAAIAVMMGRRFGTGGNGEIRNLALLKYLEGRRSVDKFDALDDLIWWNDKDSPTTVAPAYDLSRDRGIRLAREATREESIAHYGRLPNVTFFELVPALTADIGADLYAMADQHGVVPKMGSYAILRGPRFEGDPAVLLSGPQMGHSNPSPVYETAIRTPESQVNGITVPGVPGVLIGYTPTVAWGLTTGVADIQDVVMAKAEGETEYLDGNANRLLERIEQTIAVKGEDPRTVVVERTGDGPVILRAKQSGVIFSLRSSHEGRELSSWAHAFRFGDAETAQDILKAATQVDVAFNVFAADVQGNIGWRYAGRVPVRVPGMDTRLPLPAGPDAKWLGYLDAEEMPHALNPPYIINWNNKPVDWWPNMDTPTWGPLFRNEVLGRFVNDQIIPAGMVNAIRQAAEADTTTNGAFKADFLGSLEGAEGLDEARTLLAKFDGTAKAGDEAAAFYFSCVAALRARLYKGSLGDFLNPQFFELAVQPSVMRRALDGKGKLPLVSLFSRDRILRDAVATAWENWTPGTTYQPGVIRYPGANVPYSNRGTYIQIVTLRPRAVRAQTVLGPGNSESGEHAADQVPLVRDWAFKDAPPFDAP